MQRKKSSEADYNDFEKYVYPIENFELEENLLEPAKQLISYYREYPSEFVKEYLDFDIPCLLHGYSTSSRLIKQFESRRSLILSIL